MTFIGHSRVSVVCAEKANFELTNRVPLIIRAPAFAASAGKRTTVFYDHVDLYPTLAELAGLPSPQPAIGALSFLLFVSSWRCQLA